MLLLIVLLVGSRLSFRALGEFAARHRKRSGRRVLIYGAGDAGTVLLREILNNNRYNYVPLGFLDDDHRLKGRKIHGYDVLGGLADLETLIFHGRIDAVLVSTGHLTADREAELRRLCNESGIPLINLHFELQPFELQRLEETPAAK
jgi:UDP-GlcNAc:undecaprenyl-phosphate/decaprenyl-phosphate GlcNAc-1-phosphate transferase